MRIVQDGPQLGEVNSQGGLLKQYLADGWNVVGTYRNPWGRVPATAAGQSLDGRARTYVERLLAAQTHPDPPSRRHHYVPKTYLRHWSPDGRRVWSLDTTSGQLRELSVNDVCVEEDFYRVVGQNGEAHNRVERMFGVVDSELHRIQILFDSLTDPEALEFDDLIGLGVSVALQRARTAQQRRLLQQQDAWLIAQDPNQFRSMSDPEHPHRTAGIHTEIAFRAMWRAADLMTVRSIEIWDDPEGRFWTCDAPVLSPFRRNQRPDTMSAPQILWPISPHRVIALTNEPSERKARIHAATGKERGLVREAVLQGRERWVFASAEQVARLPETKKFRRRAQMRMRCSQRTPSGRLLKSPECCVEMTECFGTGPDVALCSQGLHTAAPGMWHYA